MVLATCVVTQGQCTLTSVCTAADVGRVVNDRVGVRHAILRICAAVVLTAAVAFAFFLDGAPELAVSAPSFVVVERVVAAKRCDHVLDGSRATEEFHAVVGIGDDFNVVKRRA